MKDVEYLLYALRSGESERYTEDLICTKCKNQKDIDKVIKVAKLDGWHSFRISKFQSGELPDFIGAIEKGKVKKKKR